MGLLHRILHPECSKEHQLVIDLVGIAGYNRIKILQTRQEEKRVAATFVKYGYGAKVYKQNLKDVMKANYYNNHATNIVKNTLRILRCTVRVMGQRVQ